MAKLEKKIDDLIDIVTELKGKVTLMDSKLDKINDRVTDLKTKFENHETKFEELTSSVDKKVEQNEFDEHKKLLEKLQEYVMIQRKETLAQEAYTKRMNILIHGIEEQKGSVWENQEITLNLFDQFLRDGLKLDNPLTIKPLDLHRLPQHPVFRNGEKINRPIIAKLRSAVEKHEILEALRNLRSYNEDRKARDAPLVYVTEHLPVTFQEQRKSLMPIFKQAKKDKSKTAWRVVKGEYCLFVDNEKISPIYRDHY